MDAVRLNFSHGAHEEHASRAALAREVQAELGRPLALIADLQGPKLRVSGVDEAADSGDRRRGRSSPAAGLRSPATWSSRLPSSPTCSSPGTTSSSTTASSVCASRHVGRRPRALPRRRRRRGEARTRASTCPAASRSRSRRSPRRTSTTSTSRSGSGSTTSRSRSSAPPPTSRELKELIAERGSEARVIAKIEKAGGGGRARRDPRRVRRG